MHRPLPRPRGHGHGCLELIALDGAAALGSCATPRSTCQAGPRRAIRCLSTSLRNTFAVWLTHQSVIGTSPLTACALTAERTTKGRPNSPAPTGSARIRMRAETQSEARAASRPRDDHPDGAVPDWRTNGAGSGRRSGRPLVISGPAILLNGIAGLCAGSHAPTLSKRECCDATTVQLHDCPTIRPGVGRVPNPPLLQPRCIDQNIKHIKVFSRIGKCVELPR